MTLVSKKVQTRSKGEARFAIAHTAIRLVDKCRKAKLGCKDVVRAIHPTDCLSHKIIQQSLISEAVLITREE